MDLEKAVTFNILIKEEAGMCIAHCLELDIVATADSMDQAAKDIVDLLVAQVSYAFTHDNLDNLYRPAPPEVWKDFYRCQRSQQQRLQVPRPKNEEIDIETFVPPWIIANTCLAPKYRSTQEGGQNLMQPTSSIREHRP